MGQRILSSKESFWQASIRYLVYGTIGCYFVKPDQVKSDTQGATQPEGKADRQSDDSKTNILKPSPDKLCFPGEPRRPAPERALRAAIHICFTRFAPALK